MQRVELSLRTLDVCQLLIKLILDRLNLALQLRDIDGADTARAGLLVLVFVNDLLLIGDLLFRAQAERCGDRADTRLDLFRALLGGRRKLRGPGVV